MINLRARSRSLWRSYQLVAHQSCHNNFTSIGQVLGADVCASHRRREKVFRRLEMFMRQIIGLGADAYTEYIRCYSPEEEFGLWRLKENYEYRYARWRSLIHWYISRDEKKGYSKKNKNCH